MAAPAFRAAGTAVFSANSVANPTVLAPTKSGSTVNGDLMLCITESRSRTATVATPTGWTAIGGATSATASGGKILYFARIADGTGSDAPSISWSGVSTGTSGDSCGARILSFSACLFDRVGTQPAATDQAATTSFTLPAITTNVANAMVVGAAMRVNDTAHTFTVTNFTERSDDHTTTGTGHGTETSSLVVSSAGSSGTGTVTPSDATSSRVLAATIAFAPKDVTPIVDEVTGFLPGYPAGLVTVGQAKPTKARTDYAVTAEAMGASHLLDDCWDQVVAADFQRTRVRTYYSPFTNSTIRSYGAWVNRDAVNATTDLIFVGGQNDGGGQAGVPPALRLQGTGGNDVNFTPNVVTNAGVTWSAAFPGSSQWVFVGLVYNQSTAAASLYINGSLVSTQTVGGTTTYGGTAPNYLAWGGGPNVSETIDGKLYGVFVVEGALTATQWAQLWEAPAVPGGATAGGSGPAARVVAGVGGATAGGSAPAARVAIPQGGAPAGGIAPAESVATSETPVPGGAPAGGSSPAARVSVRRAALRAPGSHQAPDHGDAGSRRRPRCGQRPRSAGLSGCGRCAGRRRRACAPDHRQRPCGRRYGAGKRSHGAGAGAAGRRRSGRHSAARRPRGCR